MKRVEIIGNATLYLGLTRSQRHRLRKKGIPVPFKPQRSGFVQSPEHIEKRKREGEKHYAWLGDAVTKKGGRTRALRLYQELPTCACGNPKTERHHRDENPANNTPDNIAFLCRKCHMAEHKRLRACKK